MTDTNKERAEFEAWYASQPDATAEPELSYELDEAGMNELIKDCIWEGWKARAAKAPAAEPVAWRQFMADVLTAAGLVSHGKQCKALGDRLMKGCTTFRAPPAPTEQWVSVAERLPEPGNPVLLDIGKRTPIRAMWAAKHTVEVAADDESDFGEYDEERDMYYCPEGWYEWNQNEEVHWAVTETALNWMHLPKGPTNA